MLTATIIIPAAGKGTRMGQPIAKQFIPLGDVPIIVHTIRRFHTLDCVERIILGASVDTRDQLAVLVEQYGLDKCSIVLGGDTRQATVKQCLQVVSDSTYVVAVHDSVRPFVSESHLLEVLQQAATTGVALSAMPAKDTIKQRLKNGKLKTIDRNSIYLAATPQAATTALMKRAYAQAIEATDEASLLEALGQPITIVPCGYDNIKITTPEDLAYAEYLMTKQTQREQVAALSGTVTIYTDGACSGNPGPGGYGAILMQGTHRKELAVGYTHTTNNRMELMAMIAALESLKNPSSVELYSDSKYAIDSITKGWVYGWQKKGWIKADKKPAVNVDLWKRLLPLLEAHTVKFIWVKGHADNPYNNRCDELAVAAAKSGQLIVDEGFTH